MKKEILRKYFHGLTDEQFEEKVSNYPLNNVFGAMEEYAKAKSGQHETIVNCKYPRRTQDDFVFIYRNNDGDCRVFGISDANHYHKKLFENGYKHTATLSASIWIERLIESSHYDRGDMIDSIDA